MKSTSAKSTINAPQPDASSLAWRLNSLAFEASISPLIDITVSSVSAFALRQAPQQSKNAVPLRCEAESGGRQRAVDRVGPVDRRAEFSWLRRHLHARRRVHRRKEPC